MDRFFYLPAFGENGEREVTELQGVLQAEVIQIPCNYLLSYGKCMKDISRRITENIDEEKDRICIMGTELGGFYALQFRHPSLIQAVAWDPLVWPALQLCKKFAEKGIGFVSKDSIFQKLPLSYT